jgi:putative spermidine/putrescine transport system permease protein
MSTACGTSASQARHNHSADHADLFQLRPAPAPWGQFAMKKRLNLEPLFGLLLVAPVIAVLGLLILYPAFEALRFSLGLIPEDNPAYASGMDLIRSKTPSLAPFERLFSSPFFAANFGITWRVSLWSVVLLVLVSYPLALFGKYGQGRLAGLSRGFSLLPMFIPTIIATYALITFYGDNGWLEALLNVVGVAYTSIIRQEAGIVMGHVWVGIPFAVLMLTSGLDGIGSETLEAARDQGASFWTVFWRIIVPLNIVPLLIVVTFSFIGIFGSYTVPYMLGASSPQMLGVSMTLNFGSFRQPQTAVTMAVVSFAICALAGALYVWATTRRSKGEP